MRTDPDPPAVDRLPRPLHIAHRGGALVAPENTLLAFRRAVEVHRTDVLELDVQATADGELVVFHDDTLERCTDGEGPVAALTFAELARLDAGHRFSPDGGQTYPLRGHGVGVPRLAEVLAAFPTTRLNIDVKVDRAGIEDEFARQIRAAGAAARLVCGAADDAAAGRLALALPEARRFYPAGALLRFVSALRQGAPPPGDEPYHVLEPPVAWGGARLVDATFVAAAHALGHPVWPWTVDDPEEMRDLVALGIDGIMTDRPDLLRAVLG